MGSGDTIAEIRLTETGEWVRDTVATLPPSQAELHPGLARSIALNGRTYWYGHSGSIATWVPGEAITIIGMVNTVGQIFALAGRTYVSDASEGMIYEIAPGAALRPAIPRLEAGGEYAVVGTAPHPSGRLLVATARRGLFLFDGSSLAPLPPTPALAGRRLSALTAVTDRFYAIGVENLGICFLDRDLRVVQSLERSNDNRLGQVRQLVCGRDGDLWAVLAAGIARIDFPAPVSHLEPFIENGYTFALPNREHGKLWVCADGVAYRGIYDQDRRLVRLEPDSPPERNVVCLTRDPVAGTLIASTDTGLFVREGESWRQIVSGAPGMRLFSPKPDGSR